jgi:hypothetical protein
MEILKLSLVILLMLCFAVVCLGTTVLMYHKITGKKDYSKLREKLAPSQTFRGTPVDPQIKDKKPPRHQQKKKKRK